MTLSSLATYHGIFVWYIWPRATTCIGGGCGGGGDGGGCGGGGDGGTAFKPGLMDYFLFFFLVCKNALTFQLELR